MNRKIIFISAVILSAACCAAAGAESGIEKKLTSAPLNPEFIEYLKNRHTYLRETGAGNPKTGRIPSPVDFSHLKKVTLSEKKSFSARFDLRAQNKLTPVKDQGGCGACWAFASLASLESCLLPGKETDFSEEDIIRSHGFDLNPCAGGTELMSTAYLTRWGGPVPESDMPYTYSSFSPGNEGLVCRHVQSVIFLPRRDNYLDNDTIKYFVSTYGAAATSLYMTQNSRYYNGISAAFYCSEKITVNHMVAIVGWDDNYPAANFNDTPPGKGAFIAKNSWGTRFGEDGYFYLSYYDKTLSWIACFNNAEPYTNYSCNYQYDTLGLTAEVGYRDRTAWAANVFQAVDNQPLRAVGFYATDTNVNYRLYVYKGMPGSSPRSGDLKISQTGSFVYAGFYTVTLDSPVTLNEGEIFSVVLRLENSSYIYPIACEYPYSGYCSSAAAGAGESFTGPDGITWEDFTSTHENGNVCIKAFAGYTDNIFLNVQAEKETERAWIWSRDIAKLSILIENIEEVSISKVVIYRRPSLLTPYAVHKEILPGELQAGAYEYKDFDIGDSSAYYYKVAVLNASGAVSARSEEKVIQLD